MENKFIESFNLFKRKEETGEVLFKRISISDAYDWYETKNKGIWEPGEINLIKKEIIKKSFITPNIKSYDFELSFNLRGDEYTIEKYDDDWFIFTVEDMERNMKCRLCDTIDGLIQCIKAEIKWF